MVKFKNIIYVWSEVKLFLISYLLFLFITTALQLIVVYFSLDVDGIQTIDSKYKIFRLMIPFFVITLLLFLFRDRIYFLKRKDLFHYTLFCFYLLLLPLLFCVVGYFASESNCSAKIEGVKKVKDPLLGYKYQPMGKRKETLFYKNTFVKTVSYSYDSFGRRSMPYHLQPTKVILFFGCSFTYGDGVNDNETLPYYVYMKDTNSNVFNYAVDGYGPQQAYVLSRDLDLKKEINNGNANGVYVYIEDHVKRAIPCKSHFWGWTNIFPAFVLEKDNLVYKGNLQSTYPFKAILFSLLNNSLFFSGIDVPQTTTEKEYQLVAALIAKTGENFKRQFTTGNFSVFIYPNQDTAIVQFLRKRNITVIIPPNILPSDSLYFFPHHGHPTPLANKIVANYLYSKLY